MQTMFVGPTPAHPSSPIEQKPSMPSDSQPGPEPDAVNPELAVSMPASQPQTRERSFYYRSKRLFDLTVVSLTLGLIWPLLGLLALVITLDSSGSVLVGQRRVGVRRQRIQGQTQWQQVHFIAYQFRTTQGDERVTRVGKFLRKTSLYELPQLWNILKGDISLVGPWPALPADVATYAAWHKRRLETLQGMTGLWQLQGCDKSSFHDRVQLDIDYIDNQSFWLDLQILFRTLLVALRPKSAE